ncbi:phage tail spike protein [Enterococcus avium]|uniref:phage tail spike protein n=1 Tax=Enterococcus avium TaxID=33945 RepID=UPI00288CCBA7|nr:phage tail spike protein [Enterococcus avium]MDT2463267.1 phage tail spike protein [Enterococcus avium]
MVVFRNVKLEKFIAMAELSFSHKVNGEKSIKGTIYSGDDVINGIDRGWSLEFQGEVFYITYALPVDNGDTISVEFDAIHEFFYKMGKSSVYKLLNGSNTAKAYLDFIFNGSGYSYNLGVALPAFEKQNFGMKNRLALFNDFINSTSTEFKIVGKTVSIVNKIGSDLSTIVRKGFNMQDLGLEHNIGDFVTYAKGFGAFKDPDDESKGRLETDYKSPLAAIYGILEADPVVDERFTSASNLQEKLKKLVESSYNISVSLTVEDLQRAGYKYSFPSPGDYISAINEDLKFQQKIRIVGIDESFDVFGNSLDKSVTCSSLNLVDQKNQADASNSQNWSDIINGIKPIPNEWLTDAIQNATNALLNAQTELKFTSNGIVAVEKGNSNRLVILNSAGVGVSTDGGKTFENALTADGVNASAITTGILRAINIIGVAITGSTIDGGEITSTSGTWKTILRSGTLKNYIDNELITSYDVNGLRLYGSNSDVTASFNRTKYESGKINATISAYPGHELWISHWDGSAHEASVVIDGQQGLVGIYQPMTLYADLDVNRRRIIDSFIDQSMRINPNTKVDFHSNIDMHGYSILNSSDIRLKENIEQSTIDAIAETKKLNFVEFNRKQNYQSDDPNRQPNTKRELGLIAQFSPFLAVKSEKDNYLRLDMNKQIMLNTMTNKQLIEIIEKQEERLSKIERILKTKGDFDE